MQISVVIPVHNEGSHLEKSVGGFIAQLPSAVREALHEILLVENGSRDDSLAVCRQLEKNLPGLIRVLQSDRASYGQAIRTGIMQATGTHVAILECDFLDVHFLETAMEWAERAHSRFVLASKRHPDSRDERPASRRLLTALLRVVLRFSTGYVGSDTRGLKFLEACLGRQVCRLAITSDEFFQTEITLLAWRLGVKIKELPIAVREVRPAPVSAVKRIPVMWRMPLELRRSISRDLSEKASTLKD